MSTGVPDTLPLKQEHEKIRMEYVELDLSYKIFVSDTSDQESR